MTEFKIVEYSVLLEYALAYCAAFDCYVLFAPYLNNAATTLLNALERSPVTFIADEDRAKGMCNAPQWSEIIDEITNRL